MPGNDDPGRLLVSADVEITERLQPTLERIAVALERIADVLETDAPTKEEFELVFGLKPPKDD